MRQQASPSGALGGMPSAARPLAFSETIGLFMPANGKTAADVGVLFVSPWGLEEMCLRKFWRIIADDLSARGIASLRFDYPGTGDALDRSDFWGGLTIWEDAVVAAADRLAAMSGRSRIVIVAQGLGTIIALRAIRRLDGVAGLVALAPVTSGRAYLREMQIWAKMVEEGLGIAKEHRAAEGIVIAGLAMPEEIAADIRKFSLATLEEKPAPQCLVMKRPDRPGDTEFAAKLAVLGAAVTEADYQGYDDLVSNPATAVMPQAARLAVVEWITKLAAALPPCPTELRPETIQPAVLHGPDFREEGLNFGKGGRLYGVLCEPLGERKGATVLLVGTAYDRASGWARSGVRLARDLAARGIPSLRFDTANVADSPPVPGLPDQVLYHEAQSNDVRAAVDVIEERHLLPVVTSGRCSGAYLAFRSALQDARIQGVVAVNPFVFYWDPKQDIDESLRFVPRTLGDYKGRLLQAETFQRLLQGRIDIARAATNIGRALGRRLARHAMPLIHMLPQNRVMRREVVGAFHMLSDRGVPVALLYSENDVGLDHFAEQFGSSARGLRRYKNVDFTILEGADHNLTPEPARLSYFETLSAVATALDPQP